MTIGPLAMTAIAQRAGSYVPALDGFAALAAAATAIPFLVRPPSPDQAG